MTTNYDTLYKQLKELEDKVQKISINEPEIERLKNINNQLEEQHQKDIKNLSELDKIKAENGKLKEQCEVLKDNVTGRYLYQKLKDEVDKTDCGFTLSYYSYDSCDVYHKGQTIAYIKLTEGKYRINDVNYESISDVIKILNRYSSLANKKNNYDIIKLISGLNPKFNISATQTFKITGKNEYTVVYDLESNNYTLTYDKITTASIKTDINEIVKEINNSENN